MLKNVLVLIFVVGSALSSMVCLASENQATASHISIVAKSDSLNGAATNKFIVTDGIANVKTSGDVPTEAENDDGSTQTSFLMLLLSLLGYIALSNRRNI